MTYSTLDHHIDEGILTITLNRPDSLNAFTPTMADELERTFNAANDNDEVRAIVVTGAGRAFCAGMDLGAEGNVFGLDESRSPTLADMSDLDSPEIRRVRDTGGRVTLAIHSCLKPVIAAINGPAVGIGASMTLAMDARLMSTTARYGLVFGRLGITPEAASTWFLPRVVGMARALDLVYSADILDAEATLAAGIASAIHPPDRLIQQAHELADRWTLNRSPVATALTRQMIYRNACVDNPESAHRVESLAMFYTSTGDGAEGVAAFREKRPATFEQKASRMPPFYDDWIAASTR
ncbi:crotonase/enoyl-CoA hydratase family protein [Saccharopolyspora sp. TS4A08]|uniref:Crotonase/enoyl-CoA hydratase family protein n=1 Tax=Saccharopolyspora ipomoeae TaxID=3042027 RepID=A0ABT6PRF4_9PSEU|nr:crotonase/enoyl-CoA hydratase family protein [Saccharopolyspora sp. TS4A08]MDI2030582.1 crotonase/enoyl-CoA hydratase family protein [Saccharopolyspora sp. TS4A08]